MPTADSSLTRLPAPRQPAAPDATGRYLLLDQIGGGATGTVWRARDRTTGDTVAVKLLRADLMRRPKMVTRFIREREILLRLENPYLVRVHDMLTMGDTLGLVMDLVPGGSLRDLLTDRRTLPPALAATLLAQVASALATAHGHGVVHRDVKPDNVLLHESGPGAFEARLTDFGVARVLDTPGLTTPEALIGTPNYMAPELIDGRVTSPSCDVYAVGVMLFELVVGRQPFAGGSVLAVLRRHVDYLPPRVAGVPEPVTRVVEACLDKRVDKRPTTTELVTSLKSLARQMDGVSALTPAATELDGSGGRAGSVFWSSSTPSWPVPGSPAWPGSASAASVEPASVEPERRWGHFGLAVVTLTLAVVAYLLGHASPAGVARGPSTVDSPPASPGSAPDGSAQVGAAPSASATPRAQRPVARSRPIPGAVAGSPSAAPSTGDSYGPWICSDAYLWDLGHPVQAKPCHSLGPTIRAMGRLQGVPGVQADVTIRLVDLSTGDVVGPPHTCRELMFTDFAPEHQCGPFDLTGAVRGGRYQVLQQWTYTGRSILPGGEARGPEFTW